MSENIAKYGIGIDFKQLTKLKKELKELRKLQSSFKKGKISNSGLPPKSTMQREANDYAVVQKGMTARCKKEQKRRDDIYKVAGNKVKARDKLNNSNASARTRQAVGNITAPSGAGDMKAYYKQLEVEQKKALRNQEQLGAAMARDTNKNIRAQKARTKALERAKEAVRNSALMMQKEAKGATLVAQQRIRIQVATAKSAQDIRRILATERASLKVTKQKSFLMRRMQSSSQQLVGNMASVFAVGAASVYITKTGQDFERATNTLTALSGSAEEAGKEMEYLKKFTYDMGLPLRETSKDYAKLIASVGDKLPLQQSKALFEDLGKASVVMGSSAEDSSGIFKALGQMLSKGKIQAEEYRGQLGDRMPIALEAMTKASVKAGIVTDDMITKYGSASAAMEKLMSDGKLLSKDILPYFGAEISKIVDSGLEGALKGNIVAMGRLQNASENAANTISKAGWSEGLTSLFKATAEMLKENEVLFISIGKVMGKVFKGVAWSIKNIISPAFSALGSIFHMLTDIFGETSVTFGLAGLAIVRMVGTITALLPALTTAFGFLGISVNAALWPVVGTLAAILAGLVAIEEVAELISPTGKQTVLGDILGIDAAEAKKTGGLFGKEGGMAVKDILGNTLTGGVIGAATSLIKHASEIVVHSTLHVDGEEMAKVVSRSETLQNTVSGLTHSSNF